MELAEKFGRPILSFVDTAGAYPGIDAEERGQAEAIAVNLREMARFHVPIIVTVTGEGGSGGALALGIGDRVLMLEHSTYSVISPEGCASILWKDAGRKKDAAEAMRLTAADLRELDVIDEIVPEPPGGAHADPAGSAAAVGEAIERHLDGGRRPDRRGAPRAPLPALPRRSAASRPPARRDARGAGPTPPESGPRPDAVCPRRRGRLVPMDTSLAARAASTRRAATRSRARPASRP